MEKVMSNAVTSYNATIDYLSFLVCGLTPDRRKNRLFAMLRAFVDDSDSEPSGHVFVLAGFVASRERWNAFTEEWNLALKGKPRTLQYFKMSEANSLKWQFADWTNVERDLKLRELAVIIRNHAQFAIRASLRWKEFKEIQEQFPDYQQEPYDALFQTIMALAVKGARQLPVPDKVEFIFDEQGHFGKRARETFELAKAFLPPEVLDYVAYEPLHRSEQEFLPLQAADMLAWQSRRFMADHEIHGLEKERCYCETMKFLDEIPVIEHRIDRLQLLEFFRDMRQRISETS
jgi:hypothetical protein